MLWWRTGGSSPTSNEGFVRMRNSLRALAIMAALIASPLAGQVTVPSTLSLADALDIAQENNPSFLQTRNDERLADWDVKQAYGQLLPTASANSGVSWQGAGEQRFGSLTLGDLGFGGQPSYYFSNYSVNFNYSLSWATLKGPAQAKANRGTTVAQIRVAESNLVAQVTNAYLEMLRQQEAVRLTEQQLENTQFNYRLAQGQLEVGSVTPIDVGLAEIQVGRSEVGVLQARNALETGRMRLLQQLGLGVDQVFELGTIFVLTEPSWDLDELIDMALGQNPTLQARRSSKASADIGVSKDRSAYYPSISMSTGLSGFTRQASSTASQVAQAQGQIAGSVANCQFTNDLYSRLADPLPGQDCSRFAFTDTQRQAIEDGNNAFPFNFDKSPPSLSFGISIPIFQGLSRQRNLEAARLQRDDITQQVREQELSLQADLAIGLANVRTAFQSAELEERNRVLAEQQLRLARERYQLGAITFVELVDAQTLFAQADRDRTIAIFAYHDTVTSLEALVGAPLRN